MKRRLWRWLLVSAGVLLMAEGCAVNSAPPVQWLVLAPLTSDGPATSATVGLPSVIVGPIDLPAYTERAPLLLLHDDAEMETVANARWVEPLHSSFARVLTENLARLLASGRVSTLGGAQREAAVQIAIEVTEFVTTTEGEARLTAYWRVLGDGGRTVHREERARYVEPVAPGGPAEHARALSRTLAALSRDLAAVIRQGVAR